MTEQSFDNNEPIQCYRFKRLQKDLILLEVLLDEEIAATYSSEDGKEWFDVDGGQIMKHCKEIQDAFSGWRHNEKHAKILEPYRKSI